MDENGSRSLHPTKVNVRATEGEEHSMVAFFTFVECAYWFIFVVEAVLRFLVDRCPKYIKEPWDTYNSNV